MDHDGKTSIELFEIKKKGYINASVIVGLVFCLIPGLVVLLLNALHTSRNRKVIAQVGSRIKQKYPEAQLHDY